ncbi:MAG: carboxypeptidase regulatory-like domain-containing protein, partial [Terriglobia bacterium]
MISTLRQGTISAWFLIIGLAALVVFAPALLKAQVTGATLSGSVTDVSGAVIPNAKVSIRNTATGVIRNVTANASGFYMAPNLLPGTYEVKASASGFSTVERTGITLTVGAEQVLNLALQVGKVTQTVQVTGQAPAVQLATSSMSAVVGGAAIVQLPLNGRSWTDLASLQPGVAPVETQNAVTDSSRGNRGFGAQIAISGSRPQQNNYRLDGISMNDYSNGGPGSVLGGNLGVDAVQEFSVITIDPSAEYGKTAGGVVNAIT